MFCDKISPKEGELYRIKKDGDMKSFLRICGVFSVFFLTLQTGALAQREGTCEPFACSDIKTAAIGQNTEYVQAYENGSTCYSCDSDDYSHTKNWCMYDQIIGQKNEKNEIVRLFQCRDDSGTEDKWHNYDSVGLCPDTKVTNPSNARKLYSVTGTAAEVYNTLPSRTRSVSEACAYFVCNEGFKPGPDKKCIRDEDTTPEDDTTPGGGKSPAVNNEILNNSIFGNSSASVIINISSPDYNRMKQEYDCNVNLLDGVRTIFANNGMDAPGSYTKDECKDYSSRQSFDENGKTFALRCFNTAFVCCPISCKDGYTPSTGTTDSCGCEKKAGNGGNSRPCSERPTEEGRACCTKKPASTYPHDPVTDKCGCAGPMAGKVFEKRNGVWECYDKLDEPVTTVTCDSYTGAYLVNGSCQCSNAETRLEMNGTYGRCVCIDSNKRMKNGVCEYSQEYIARYEKIIRETRTSLDNIMSTLKVSVWKDEEGNFNTARLASDSIAGVVLGTTGGLVTAKVVKKNQLKKGFEAIQCSVGGQSIGDYGDEVVVGIGM